MGEVRTLYTKTETGEEQPVITSVDVGFVVAIGEGRQLTFRTMIDRTIKLDEQKRIVRDMLSIGDHEKAHYELIDLESMEPVRARALKNAEEDVARVSAKNAKRREEIAVEIDTMQKAVLQTHETHERGFREQGRGGKFKPSQAQQNEINGMIRDIEKLRKEAADLDEAEGGERANALTALARGRADLNTCREEIAKRRHILGLPQAE